MMKKLIPLIEKPAVLVPRRIDTLYQQVKKGDIELNPKYQRGDVWTEERREHFIDSLVNNISAIELIFNEDSGTKNEECIDGKQRITTIIMFMDNELLYKRKYRFADFDPVDQKMFNAITIPCKVYHDLSEGVRMDVFNRTQQGKPLVPAEMINAHSNVDDLRTLANKYMSVLPNERHNHIKVVAQLAKFCYTGGKFGTSLRAITSFLEKQYIECKAKINRDVDKTLQQYQRLIVFGQKRPNCLEALLTLAFLYKTIGCNTLTTTRITSFLQRLRKQISTKNFHGVNDKIVKELYKDFVCKEISQVVGQFHPQTPPTRQGNTPL